MKLSKNELNKRVAEYREIYPGKTLFYTEDGNVFLGKNPAVDHANKTKQKWFESGVEKETKVIPISKKAKEAAEKQLKELELTDETELEVCMELVTALGITPASESKDDLLVALEEYKNTLK